MPEQYDNYTQAQNQGLTILDFLLKGSKKIPELLRKLVYAISRLLK